MLFLLTTLLPETEKAPARGAPTLPITTPYGVAGWLDRQTGASAVVGEPLAGALTWFHRVPGADPRAVIYATKEAGATHLISIEEVIALNRLLKSGDWLVPDDYIEHTQGQPTTFFESRGMGYLQQSPAFPDGLRRLLCDALAATVGTRHFDVGTYLAINGPRRPTPAEARAARIWGADIVGHFALPEATLAKELELGYAILAHVSTTVPPTPDEPLPPWQPTKQTQLDAIVPHIDATTLPSLAGSNQMARRLVGDEWRKWVG